MHRNCVPHWKIEYTSASGAIGTITVQADDPDEAKRIAAKMTRTDPGNVHSVCSAVVTERASAPLYGRAAR